MNFILTYPRMGKMLITPCKRSAARGKKISPNNLNYVVVQPATGLRSELCHSCPELRFACTGLSIYKSFGFSRPNRNDMRLFYISFPICETLSNKLSWSHYFELVKIDNELLVEYVTSFIRRQLELIL